MNQSWSVRLGGSQGLLGLADMVGEPAVLHGTLLVM